MLYYKDLDDDDKKATSADLTTLAGDLRDSDSEDGGFHWGE